MDIDFWCSGNIDLIDYSILVDSDTVIDFQLSNIQNPRVLGFPFYSVKLKNMNYLNTP